MNKKDYYRYIAVFLFSDDGISITFPDLPGCISFGKDENEAIKNAKEVLTLHLYGMEEDNEEIPTPSSIRDINISDNEYPVLIEAYMPPFRARQNSRFVKKTLSIPYWLNIEAEHRGINFSQTLQNALKEQLHINN